MREIGVEVDASDVARDPGLVPLVEKMCPVVVRGVGAVLAVEHEIRVLVRLRFVRLDVVARRLDGIREREKRTVSVVAVIRGIGVPSFRAHVPARDLDFLERRE